MMVMKSMNVILKCNIYIDVCGWDQMVQPRVSHVYFPKEGLELYCCEINVIGGTFFMYNYKIEPCCYGLLIMSRQLSIHIY